jgi:(p)ppGpp synthase/HD superfamily hydrolase
VPLSPRFSEALVWAAQLHRDQVRKGPNAVPYVGHLLAVASIVIDYGGSEDQAIAALLHDAVEDQGGAPTLAMISRLFGPEVAAIVDGCTDTDEQPKPPWQARKDRYIEHLAEAPPSVLLVAAADKLGNARSILADLRVTGDAVWERFTASKRQSLWYYRTVVETLRSTPVNRALLAELEAVVDELERAAG